MQLNIEQRFYILEHFFRTSSVKQTIRNLYSTFGKNLAINWPPRSPDLSTLDFFLWGYVKELTFQEPPKTIPELKLKITESFEVVRQNTAMLRRVQGALVRRSELVVNQQGKHFEHKVSKKTIFCS